MGKGGVEMTPLLEPSRDQPECASLGQTPLLPRAWILPQSWFPIPKAGVIKFHLL